MEKNFSEKKILFGNKDFLQNQICIFLILQNLINPQGLSSNILILSKNTHICLCEISVLCLHTKLHFNDRPVSVFELLTGHFFYSDSLHYYQS